MLGSEMYNCSRFSCTYEGEYFEGKRHGHGVYKAHGVLDQGEFKDDKIFGHGFYSWADGRTYEGKIRK
jgi:hypothetical protein